MSDRILFVDDDQNILEAYQRGLRKKFPIDVSLCGKEGLRRLETGNAYAVIVADMQMPGMNGTEFLREARRMAPDSIRIMLTGNADQRTAADAVNEGHVFRFLNKPCAIEGLTLALEAGLLQHRLIIAERELLEKTLNGAVKILTDVLEALDSNAFGRGRHLRDAAHALMRTYAVNEAWAVELAAMLSPIGRVTLPSTLILKERNGQPLTEQEKDMLRRVPEIGAGLLEQIPRLENVAQIIRLQHHGYAGPGSTAGTTGQTDIPAGSRILKALGDLATLQATGHSKPDALRQMWAATGQYDQTILAAVEANAAITFANGDKSSLPPLSLAINELQAGHILAADIVNHDGSLVVPAGLTLSSTMVQRLLNFWEIRAIAGHAAVRPDFPLP